MSINLNDNIEDLILALTQATENLELYANAFVLEQGAEPYQIDWETAWLSAGNTLPIPEDQELYWKAGGAIRGQFACINDKFYCVFPSNSVSLGGVIHFAYTKFLGWEDGQHFLFSGTQLNDSGQYVGLLRAYLDGSLEQVDFTGFTANTLLGYDEVTGHLWYIEGTDLKRINTTTEVITVIATGITVAPTEIAFDGAGDAFCTINIGAGLDLYHWDDSAVTFSSFKASITVNGVGEDPGQVICASLNYVVVHTSASNYWVQIARSGGAETHIKSNPAGATAANITAPSATSWTQILASRLLDILSIVYTELTGTPGLSEWRRTILWDMATGTFTDADELPTIHDDFIQMCLNESPAPDTQDFRRDNPIFALSSSYRKRVSTAWEYHNITAVRWNNDLSRKIIETNDNQIFILSNGSSGKVWRISDWDYGESDAVILGVVDITGDLFGVSPYLGNIDISERPAGYDLIEITVQSGVANGAEAVLNGGWMASGGGNNYDVSNGAVNGGLSLQGGSGLAVDNNTYAQAGDYPQVHGVFALTPASLAQAFIFMPDGDTGMDGHLIFSQDTTATGVAGETVTQYLHIHYLPSPYAPMEVIKFNVFAGGLAKGAYFMVRALRTEGRRQGGAYYDPAMA